MWDRSGSAAEGVAQRQKSSSLSSPVQDTRNGAHHGSLAQFRVSELFTWEGDELKVFGTTSEKLIAVFKDDNLDIGSGYAGTGSTLGADGTAQFKGAVTIDGELTADWPTPLVVGGGAHGTPGTNSTILGEAATGAGASAVATGHSATATGDDSTAVGQSANAAADGCTAIGHDSKALGTNTVAVGSLAEANGASATAVGESALASEDNATALGRGAGASAVSATAVGSGTTASGNYATAMGDSAVSSGADGVVVGDSANSSGLRTTVVGRVANARDSAYTVVVGYGAEVVNAADPGCVAVGSLAQCHGSGSAAIGYATDAGADGTAVGANAQALGVNGASLGRAASAGGADSTALGRSASASATRTTAVGKSAASTHAGADAYGAGAVSFADNAIQWGCATTPKENARASVGANGQTYDPWHQLDEQTTLDGVTTDTTIEIPANSLVKFVSFYVCEIVTGATTWDLGVVGDPNRYADDQALAVGTTGVCSDSGGFARYYVTATKLRFTANGSAFTGGKVRVSIVVERATAPTS